MSFIRRKYRYKVGRRKITGLARIYIQNAIDLAAAKFLPDTNYSVDISQSKITLTVSPCGDRKVIRSKKNASIVELSNKSIDSFCGDAEYVTVSLRSGKIVISLHGSIKQRQARESSMMNMLSQGRITTASLFSGVGALAYQLHRGFAHLGISSEIQFANEIDPIAAEINVNFNPIWEFATKCAVMECDDIQMMDFSDLPTNVGFLEIAIPCVGHSQLTAKENRDLNHPLTGKLFIPTINAIKAMNPCTILIECTPGLANSDTLSCIKDQLIKLGYVFETTSLKGSEFGDFEHRNRFCLFAVSNGVKHLFPSLQDIKITHTESKSFASIMDRVSDTDPVWKEYSHVKARNAMNHLGYKNILINGATKHMPAILSSYGSPKAGQPFVAHPSNPDLQRMISVREHSRIRQLPNKLVEALDMLSNGTLLGRTRTGKTLAHRFLGNMVSPTPWQRVIEHMFSSFNFKRSAI